MLPSTEMLARETPPRAWGRLPEGDAADSAKETPPRAWGRRQGKARQILIIRNTPTSVGKTWLVHSKWNQSWKHPHERGEDSMGLRRIVPWLETPPRAWGRPVVQQRVVVLVRNTPTSVGKTHRELRSPASTWKHPHERGEDEAVRDLAEVREETPPRAWGRRGTYDANCSWQRNTPTSVGKTRPGSFSAYR